MISEARQGDDDFTIWLTNPTNEFELPNIGKGVQAFFDAEKAAGRNSGSISGSRRSVGRDRVVVQLSAPSLATFDLPP
jgi:hypothetical protein